MKNAAWFLALIGLVLSSCTTQKQATSYANDEVYGTTAPSVSAQVTNTQPTDKGTQVITTPDKTSVSKPGSSTFEDDYNDYSYSNRIQKFNSSDTTKGYFDESNSSSGQSGSDPNVNVYMGFGAGYGGYYGSSFGFSYGYPYSAWGWDYGWGYPYSGWGYPYYGWGYPNYGYNPWYNPCCYCYGYYDGYYGEYSPYAASGTYYGSRQSLYRSDNGGTTLNTRDERNFKTNPSAPNDRNQSTAPAYTRTDQSARSTVGNSQPAQRSSPVSQEKYRYTRTENQRQAPNQRTTQKIQVQNKAERTQPSPKYIRPENAGAIQRAGSTQSYSSPAYRQPKTSQEYLAPRSQTQGSSRTNSESRTAVRSTTSGSFNQNTSPSNEAIRSGNNTGRTRSSGYSEPARSNNSFSSPARTGSSGTYSAPARSTGSGTYSAPTRSGGNSAPSGGGSYSAPSRSSGGSGGGGGSAPASGGSSGRHR